MTLRLALQTLQLPPKTTLSEARRAYRQLAREHHPDASQEQSAESFVQLVAAYEYVKAYVASKGQGKNRRPVAVSPAQRTSTSAPIVKLRTVVDVPSGGSPVETQFCEPLAEQSFATPVFDATFDEFVQEMRAAEAATLNLFPQDRQTLRDRIFQAVQIQISSYGSGSELRERVQADVNAILQREMWQFLEYVARRVRQVDGKFRAWATELRGLAFGNSLPHGTLEYLCRPGGLALSFTLFALIGSGSLLGFYLWPLPTTIPAAVRILAGFVIVLMTLCVSIWGGESLYCRSARKRDRWRSSVLMADIGLDDLSVGALPVSSALTSGERAGLAGAAGLVTLWMGVEPITGIVAAAVAALWAALTGKPLEQMKQEAITNMIQALQPRLDDCLDRLSFEFRRLTEQRIEVMHSAYIELLNDHRLRR